MEHCIKDNGSFYVTIEGEDQLGFLAAMFNCFADCLLFPWELDVSTSGSRVRDTFHLMGAAGIAVTEDMKIQLSRALERIRQG